MRTKILSAIALLVSLLATAVQSEERIAERPATPQQVEETFKALDRNQDERISKVEAAREASLRRRFASVDSDADGRLSKSEFRARPSSEKFE
jgi:Ca2+-binding EF-hand superfamily protein